MQIDVRSERGVVVVGLEGELTWGTIPEAQPRILGAAPPGCKLALDLSRVRYLSSAGLRLLLVVYRTVTAQGGRVVLIGLSEDLADTMALTGFLDFLPHRDTLEAGVAELLG
jgi:anti-sigma B factor antagonist